MRTIERSILDKRLCARKIKDRIIKYIEAAERPFQKLFFGFPKDFHLPFIFLSLGFVADNQ